MSSNQTDQTWMQRLWQLRPTERLTRTRNMAQLISGLFACKSVHVGKVATTVVSAATLPSVTRRLRRFLNNPAVRIREGYAPIVCDLLQSAAQTGGEIRLIADASQVALHHQLLVTALAYRRRAIPLVWTWLRAGKGHSSGLKQLVLLSYLQRLLPAGIPVLLVGDSEFGAIPVLQQVERWGWYYVLRQKANNQVHLGAPAPWRDFGRVVTQPRQSAWFEEVQLRLKYAHAPNLLAHWRSGEAEPWLVATNLPLLRLALRVYGRRMWIEQRFGDFKGHGFHLAKTHLHPVARLSRLTLAVALLYVWLVAVGTRIIKNGERHLVDRADRRNLSIFQIGLRWIERGLTNARPIPIHLSLIRKQKLSGN